MLQIHCFLLYLRNYAPNIWRWGNFVTLPNLTNTINDMKKILLLFAAVGALISAGCSDEKDGSGDISYLIGTEWAGLNNGIEISLKFTKENGALLKASALNIWFDYTAKSSSIVHLSPQEYGYYSFDGHIDNDNMTLINSETGQITYYLTKQ